MVHRVRLLIGRDGSAGLEAKPLPSPNRGRRLSVCLARTPIDRTNAFLYHKTTQREVYDNALAAHAGFDDVILWNQHGEITESCLANVVVELDGALYTPPVHCGLLAGTYRAWLLDEDRIKERVILVSDLRRCTRVSLVNSVRRERDVELDLSLAPVHRSEHAVE